MAVGDAEDEEAPREVGAAQLVIQVDAPGGVAQPLEVAAVHGDPEEVRQAGQLGCGEEARGAHTGSPVPWVARPGLRAKHPQCPALAQLSSPPTFDLTFTDFISPLSQSHTMGNPAHSMRPVGASQGLCKELKDSSFHMTHVSLREHLSLEKEQQLRLGRCQGASSRASRHQGQQGHRGLSEAAPPRSLPHGLRPRWVGDVTVVPGHSRAGSA